MKTWTLEQVESGVREVRNQIANGTLPGVLDMSESLEHHECGTVGCIGGWMIYNRHLRDTGQAPRSKWETPWHSLGEIIDQIARINAARAHGIDNLMFIYSGVPSAADVVAACDKFLAGSNDPWVQS